ncbi:hypothetical protein T4D_15290 [Trichinella pseudospiralis]|uniref:Uncharacterized protein n=1 Tax=Trichinella pseudospiralis TaxID=6337 RepID=A0A0V1G1D7_TRIPS|nr:hypothetical protein T4D_15290 [Trichinella pseudospiralis]
MYSHWAKRYLKLPEHRRDLQISVTFRTTRAGDEFLLWQSASRHMLVFVVGSKIRLLAAMRTWGMDDTFKLVVQWYQQLFLPSMLLWQINSPRGQSQSTSSPDTRDSWLLHEYSATRLQLALPAGGA